MALVRRRAFTKVLDLPLVNQIVYQAMPNLPDGIWLWHSNTELKIDKRGYVLLNGKKTGQFWDGTIRSKAKPLRLKVRNIAGDESVIGV